MGLFSKKPVASKAVNQGLAKAVLMPSVLTMISDGSVDDSEIAQLGNLCSFSPIFAGIDSNTLVQMIKDIIVDLRRGGLELATQTVKMQLSMPMRETAMLFAMRIALADGRIDDGERNVLMGMGERFEIPADKFMSMFEVIAMLQRRPDSVA